MSDARNEMIQSLLAGMKQSKQSDNCGLSHEQMVIRMKEVLALREEKHSFSKGDVLAHKYPHLTSFKFGDRPALFIEYLDIPLEGIDFAKGDELSSNSATTVVDCKICIIQRMSTTDDVVVEYFVDSNDFRPA